MTCGPGSPGTPPMTWPPGWPRCGPAPARRSATPPAWRCASWPGPWSSPGGQLERLDELIVPLVTARAPGLLALYGVGHDTAAKLLIAAGDHPGRLRSEAAWAHLCAAAPIQASPRKVTRHRLLRRRAGAYPASPLRRGRRRPVGDGDPAAAGRGRIHRRGYGHGLGRQGDRRIPGGRFGQSKVSQPRRSTSALVVASPLAGNRTSTSVASLVSLSIYWPESPAAMSSRMRAGGKCCS